MKIAFATCAEMPLGNADDNLAVDELHARGHFVEYKTWNDSAVDWSVFDKVVVRTTWDYHYHLPEFLKWAEETSKKSVLMNSFEVIRGNADKNYLETLRSSGVSVTENYIFRNKNEAVVKSQELLKRSAIVIKPAVSASAYLTFLLRENANLEASIGQILERSDLVLQPFYDSVQRDGEVSLMFFQNEYSHAVLKRPAGGDFRVQQDHGGHTTVTDTPEGLVEMAQDALEKQNQKTTYARVDFLDWKSEPKISEIELIEPELFLRFSKDSVRRFADAIVY